MHCPFCTSALVVVRVLPATGAVIGNSISDGLVSASKFRTGLSSASASQPSGALLPPRSSSPTSPSARDTGMSRAARAPSSGRPRSSTLQVQTGPPAEIFVRALRLALGPPTKSGSRTGVDDVVRSTADRSAQVIVRPPPSLTNSPLNLQLQLISSLPANQNSHPVHSGSSLPSSNSVTAPGLRVLARPGQSESGRRDSNASAEDDLRLDVDGHSGEGSSGANSASPGMRRSASIRSNRSNISSAGGSTFSTVSMRRIQPLYNLTFHQWLPDVVTDAGTDEKIARFLKKGVELVGVVILDPIEITPPRSSPVSASSGRSAISKPVPTPPTVLQPSPAMTSSFLSRFKKLSTSFRAPAAPPAPSRQPALPSSPKLGDLPKGITLSGENPKVVPLFDPEGTVPLKDKDGHDVERRRAKGYTWVARKWLRRDLAMQLVATEAAGAENVVREEVAFEWRRGGVASSTTRSGRARAGTTPSIHVRHPSDASLPPTTPTKTTPRNSQIGPSARASPTPVLSVTTSSAPSSPTTNVPAGTHERRTLAQGGGGYAREQLGHREGERPKSSLSISSTVSDFVPSPDQDNASDAGDHSAPVQGADEDEEDLEQPWFCYLLYRPPLSTTLAPDQVHPSSPISASSIGSGSTTRKILLAKLSPLPYHSKIVASLSVPFFTALQLGDEDVEISVEDMKDILSVTAMWITVRESLGGIGERRKGDRKTTGGR